MTAPRATGTGLAAAGTALLTDRLLRRAALGRNAWTRVNYRGRAVSLRAGPVCTAGLIAGAALAGPGARRATVTAVAAAALAGRADDVRGRRAAEAGVKGLRAHARELAAGRPTAGVVKATGLAIAAASIAVAAPGTVADRVATAGVVAGSAHLVNLLDLRPGRALKVAVLAAAPLVVRGAPLAASVTGAALAVLPGDLRELTMLGDCGAAALGTALGAAAAQTAGRPGRLTLLVGLAALAAAAEAVSFSAVIAGNPPLAALDRLGRLPAA